MLANYGFEDGSGAYFITIDTDKCKTCQEKGCISACPVGIFEVEIDDWEDEIVVIRGIDRNRLNIVCVECKPVNDSQALLPCCEACPKEAIKHSW